MLAGSLAGWLDGLLPSLLIVLAGWTAIHPMNCARSHISFSLIMPRVLVPIYIEMCLKLLLYLHVFSRGSARYLHGFQNVYKLLSGICTCFHVALRCICMAYNRSRES